MAIRCSARQNFFDSSRVFGFDIRSGEVEHPLAISELDKHFTEGEIMQESSQVKNDKASTQQSDKKPYATPQLTRHGMIEDFTKQSNPGPSGVPITATSDRNLKENFAPVDIHNVLEKLAQVRVSTWNYKSDSRDVRHIGPMAQDFAKAFGVGDSDRVIHVVDSGGVTMASIQAAVYQNGAGPEPAHRRPRSRSARLRRSGRGRLNSPFTASTLMQFQPPLMRGFFFRG